MQPEIHITSEAATALAGAVGGIALTLNVQAFWRAVKAMREDAVEGEVARAAELGIDIGLDRAPLPTPPPTSPTPMATPTSPTPTTPMATATRPLGRLARRARRRIDVPIL